jgi:hypothetical protein
MTTQQLATSQGWDLNEARRYGRALCSAYHITVNAIEQSGRPRFRASKYAMSLTDEQLFTVAARKPESIVRGFVQWWQAYKLTEEADNLRIVALFDANGYELSPELRKVLTDAL